MSFNEIINFVYSLISFIHWYLKNSIRSLENCFYLVIKISRQES